jgi:hypothetical protein
MILPEHARYAWVALVSHTILQHTNSESTNNILIYTDNLKSGLGIYKEHISRASQKRVTLEEALRKRIQITITESDSKRRYEVITTCNWIKTEDQNACDKQPTSG